MTTETTNTTKPTYLRLNTTRATLIKLACEKIQEEIKLSLSNDEYIELLKIISCVSKHIQQTQQNNTQSTDSDTKKVSI